MSFGKEYVEELTKMAAKNREAFIIEELSKFVEKTDDGLVWHETVRLRLAEIKDFKQQAKETINSVFNGYAHETQEDIELIQRVCEAISEGMGL